MLDATRCFSIVGGKASPRPHLRKNWNDRKINAHEDFTGFSPAGVPTPHKKKYISIRKQKETMISCEHQLDMGRVEAFTPL